MERERLSKLYIKVKLANKRAATKYKDGNGNGNAKRIKLPQSVSEVIDVPPVEQSVSPVRGQSHQSTNHNDDDDSPDETEDQLETENEDSSSDTGTHNFNGRSKFYSKSKPSKWSVAWYGK